MSLLCEVAFDNFLLKNFMMMMMMTVNLRIDVHVDLLTSGLKTGK